jgi:hypothetical protein
MRADKLTTKFQEALADAQSLANVSDNAYIERRRFHCQRVVSAGRV